MARKTAPPTSPSPRPPARAATGTKGRPASGTAAAVPPKSRTTPAEPQAAPRPLADFPDLAEAGFERLCSRYRAVSVKVALLDAEKKTLSAQILPLMQAVEARSVQGNGWLATMARGTNTAIVPEKLLELGVSMKIITKATRTTHYDYVQVRKA